MRSELINLLSTFGYPVYLQGSMSDEEEYPASFFTFWNTNNEDAVFYDNKPNQEIFVYWVYFYTDNPETIENKLKEVQKLLSDNKWIITQKSVDVASDEPTHTGKMITVMYIKEREEN